LNTDAWKNFPGTDFDDFRCETFLGSIPLVGVTSSDQNQKIPSDSKNPRVQKSANLMNFLKIRFFSPPRSKKLNFQKVPQIS
jgi:hypothetical protein